MNLLANLVGEILTDVRALGLRREGDRRDRVHMQSNQLALTLVPGCEEFSGRRCANQTRVRDTGKADSRDMTRSCVNAWEHVRIYNSKPMHCEDSYH